MHRVIVNVDGCWHVVHGGTEKDCDTFAKDCKSPSRVIHARDLAPYLNHAGLVRALQLVERAGEHFDETITVAQAYSAIRQAILAEWTLTK